MPPGGDASPTFASRAIFEDAGWVASSVTSGLVATLAGNTDNLIAVQDTPERSHLEEWASELGVSERLSPSPERFADCSSGRERS